MHNENQMHRKIPRMYLDFMVNVCYKGVALSRYSNKSLYAQVRKVPLLLRQI